MPRILSHRAVASSDDILRAQQAHDYLDQITANRTRSKVRVDTVHHGDDGDLFDLVNQQPSVLEADDKRRRASAHVFQQPKVGRWLKLRLVIELKAEQQSQN